MTSIAEFPVTLTIFNSAGLLAFLISLTFPQSLTNLDPHIVSAATIIAIFAAMWSFVMLVVTLALAPRFTRGLAAGSASVRLALVALPCCAGLAAAAGLFLQPLSLLGHAAVLGALWLAVYLLGAVVLAVVRRQDQGVA